MEKNQENQLQIELKEDVAQGVYCNLAVISHSSSEFVLDLIRVLPGLPKAQVKSRVIKTEMLQKKENIAANNKIIFFITEYYPLCSG